jgi:Ca-activated chloride channel family protein
MLDSTNFSLEWWWILFALPLPWLYRLIRSAHEQTSPALKAPIYQALLAGTSQSNSGQKSRLSFLLLNMIWLGCLLAAARPTWIGDPVELPTTGRDLMMAVDISGSMQTEDMEINGQYVQRITAIKAIVGDFVTRREGDKLGLILFGSEPYLQAPLTFDHPALYQLLQEAEIGFAGNGTAIGSAIGLGVKHLHERPVEERVLILLTDGANTAGTLDPLQAADAAAKFKVKIYTIGVGAESMIQRGFFRDTKVNPSADLDEKTLQNIADKTGGMYFRARNIQELGNIYQELDRLEPTEQDAETLRPIKSLFYWPLSLALFASLLLFIQRAFGQGNKMGGRHA